METAVRIGDNDVFTGREVKRLLAAMRDEGAKARPVRWLSLADAAAILQVKPDTLRKRCARWGRMKEPTVRVRKQSDAAKSPWLLDEEGVWALARRAPDRGLRVVTETGTVDATEAIATELDRLAEHWCNLVTRNL